MCGVCCRIFYIPLTEEEFNSGKYEVELESHRKDFSFVQKNGLNILKKNENGCVYLKDNKCTIHDDKPKFCKDFNCDEEKHDRMNEEIKNARRA